MKNGIIILGSGLIFGTVLTLSLVSWNSNEPDKKNKKKVEKEKCIDAKPAQLPIPFKDWNAYFSINGKCGIPEVNFYYGLGTRFEGITKEEIRQAKSFNDFMINDDFDRISEIHSLNLIFVEDDKHTDRQELNEGNAISDKQRQLLLNSPFSTNFVLKAYCTRKKLNSDELEKTNYTPHLTIVPPTQATYEGGFNALIAYFKENSQEVIKQTKTDKLTPAKIYFTVNAGGTIENIKLSNTTSYTEIDNRMLELVKEMPLKWTPAKDENGNNVSQELVYTFAVEGC